ncbi:MAG: ROK family protein [Candidatus Dadabacteria bacterium]|nr:MAG: ROK family protein [Candidatus Dadabacteria bacterium]
MYWGIDLGGTKIEGVVFESINPPVECARLRLPTEAEQGYSHIIEQIVLLVEMLKKESGDNPSLIGFGTPGRYDQKTSSMKNSNTTCANGQDLKKDLTEALGVDVILENDANCFAVAEATLGAAKGEEVVFGVIMGTGVGGGIAINGKAISGLQGIAGEWGHNILDPSAEKCYCGKPGCVETIISGPALERFYYQKSGRKLKLAEIHRNYQSGSDPHATETMERLFYWFGRAISVVINILDPNVIVLGGGVSNIPELYTHSADAVAKYTFNTRVDTRIVKHALGDSAGVYGAAMLTVD